VLLGLFLGAWTLAAAVTIALSEARRRETKAAMASNRRLTRLVDESPAQMMLVHPDGQIRGPAPGRMAGAGGDARFLRSFPRRIAACRPSS
jgi:hypothetical protein